MTVNWYEHRILLQHAIFSHLNYVHLNLPVNYYKERTISRSAWSREKWAVEVKFGIFKMKVVCHIIGKSMVTTSHSKAIFVLVCFFLFSRHALLTVRLVQTKTITMKIFLIANGSLCQNDVSNKSYPSKWIEVNWKENTAWCLRATWSIN